MSNKWRILKGNLLLKSLINSYFNIGKLKEVLLLLVVTSIVIMGTPQRAHASHTVSSLSPNVGQRGTNNLALTLTGTNLTSNGCTAGESFTPNFNTGGTTGITVVSATFTNSTTAAIVINISGSATLGTRDVVFDWDPGCGDSNDTLTGGFTVIDCGDGVVSTGEQCDDNNTTNSDGCSSTCQIEAGYHCSGTPSDCCAIIAQVPLNGPDPWATDGSYVRGIECMDSGSGDMNCSNDGSDNSTVNSNNAPVWTELGGGTDDCYILDEELRVRNNCKATQSEMETVGYTNVRLVYEWGVDIDSDTGDDGDLVVQWKPNASGGPFAHVSPSPHDLTADTGAAGNRAVNLVDTSLGASANDTLIDILFHGSTPETADQAFVDNIFLCGDQIPPVCGDGMKEHDEACDDGNTDSGDGCSSDCSTVESGYYCYDDPNILDDPSDCCAILPIPNWAGGAECFDLGSGDTNCLNDSSGSDTVDSNNAPAWSESGGSGDDCAILNEELTVRDGCTATSPAISTTGYENIRFIYDWGSDIIITTGTLDVKWSDDGSNFYPVDSHDINSDTGSSGNRAVNPEDFTLGASADDNSTVHVQFYGNTNSNFALGHVDNVFLCGYPIAEEDTCGDGVEDMGEDCDEGMNNGDPAYCCTVDCEFVQAETLCRDTAGDCDYAEYCTGSDATCPDDGDNSTEVCRVAIGPCDVAESCSNASNDCPADVKSTAECRGAGGICDIAETCDGSSNDCPADVKSTAECRGAGGICDIAETCDGSSNDCPTDVKSTAECRAVEGDCDIAETCDGSSNDCPIDAFLPDTTVCRSAGGDCDTEENCPGDGANCPDDAFLPDTTVCRSAGGDCDIVENCPGDGANCPDDAFLPDTTVCRSAGGDCDIVENCPGDGIDCPQDAKSTAECRASVALCDPAEDCDGINNDCPDDILDHMYCNTFEGNLCTSDTCDPTNGHPDSGCVHVFEPDTNSNPDFVDSCEVEICRGHGFWQTHAKQSNKSGAMNITGEVIDAVVYDCIEICGEIINNTQYNNAASALEAMCVSPKSDPRTKLAAHLTATSLNCIMSDGISDCSGTSIEETFQYCNGLCADNDSGTLPEEYIECASELDCYNIGGMYDEGFCITGTCSDNASIPCNNEDVSMCNDPSTATCYPAPGCDDEELAGDPHPLGLDFEPPGPAGSPNDCNKATKSPCTIVGDGEDDCSGNNIIIENLTGVEMCSDLLMP